MHPVLTQTPSEKSRPDNGASESDSLDVKWDKARLIERFSRSLPLLGPVRQRGADLQQRLTPNRTG